MTNGIAFVGICFVIIGVGYLVLAVREWNRKNTIEHSWRCTTAKRLWNEHERKIFSYSVDGLEYTLELPFLNKVDLKVNEINIYYDPYEPNKSTPSDRWSASSFLIVFLIFSILGGSIIYFGLIGVHSITVEREASIAAGIFIVLSMVFILAGIILPFSTTKQHLINQKKKKSYIESNAVVIGLLSSMSDHSRVFMPVFEYYVQGNRYEMAGYAENRRSYTNICVPSVGSEHSIWINPANFRDAIVKEPLGQSVTIYIMGAVSFGMGSLLFFLIISNNVVSMPPIVSPAREVPFEVVGSFNPEQFNDIMAQYSSTGGVILTEIYEESLIALLNDPTTSPLQRAVNENFLVPYYNPIALHLIHADNLGQNVLRLGHGRGNIPISQSHLKWANKEVLEEIMRRHGHYNILDVQYVIFDDPHFRYEPAQFVWFQTEQDVIILWMTHEGYNIDISLHTAGNFASNWQNMFNLLP